MRFLRALRLARVHAGSIRDVLGAVHFLDLCAARANCLTGEHDRIGTHIGDVAVFVEPLRGGHRVAGAHAQFAARLLLERTRGEGSGGAARVRLGLEISDGGLGPLERFDEKLCAFLGQDGDVSLEALLEFARIGEVTSRGDALAIERAQLRGERGRIGAAVTQLRRNELARQIPVRGRREGHALAFALHNEARCDGLDAARARAAADLAPQHGGEFVAHEAVENTAGFLRIDERHVELASLGKRLLDGFLRDFVEHHAVHGKRFLRLEGLEKMPRDRFTLAVLIGGEVESIGLFEELLELGDGLLLVGVHDVVGLEALFDVDGETTVGPLFHVGGQLFGQGKVTNVPHGGGDREIVPEVSPDGLCLRGGLNDHEVASAHSMYFLTAVCAWREYGAARFALNRTVTLRGFWLLDDVEKSPFDEGARRAHDCVTCSFGMFGLVSGFEEGSVGREEHAERVLPGEGADDGRGVGVNLERTPETPALDKVDHHGVLVTGSVVASLDDVVGAREDEFAESGVVELCKARACPKHLRVTGA